MKYDQHEVVFDIYEALLHQGYRFCRTESGVIFGFIPNDGWNDTGELIKEFLYTELADFLERYVT